VNINHRNFLDAIGRLIRFVAICYHEIATQDTY